MTESEEDRSEDYWEKAMGTREQSFMDGVSTYIGALRCFSHGWFS